MRTKTKKKTNRDANKKALAQAFLAETIKKHMVESVVFMERAAMLRASPVGLTEADVTAINLAISSEVDHFRDLIAKFLTARGLPVTTIEAPPPVVASAA